MEKKKLLVMDDDTVTRELIQDLLQYDCDCISAQNGVEGLSYLEQHPGQVDLIVVDLIMPVMDGFEVMKCIQSNALNRNIPILVITASDQQEDIKKAFACGADDILMKPLQSDIVRKRILNMFDIADRRNIHNVMEDMVRIEIEENIDSLGICPCPVCRRDLMTLTLNNVPPKYVNTEKGAIMSKVGSMSRAEKIKLLAEIAHYAEKVRDRPRHSLPDSNITK